MTNKEKLEKKFENIDYFKIPFTNAVPNERTLKALKEPVHFVK